MPEQLQLDIDPLGELRPLWDETLRLLKGRVGREAFDGWLAEIAPVAVKTGTVVLALPNATARAWVDRKYRKVLTDALTEAHGEPVELELIVVKNRAASQPAASIKAAAPTDGSEPARASRGPESALFRPIPLNDKFTFENFVVGHSNRFAHAAAAAVADRPGREYNPLFIYGGVGLGKTHLLQAIGHRLKQQNKTLRIVYVSGETFTSHFISSIREHRQEEFRRAYRGVDVWLVDDVQFIADKSGTREEFFHTFNEMYLTNRQIVLASDRPPRELRLMEDRLRSRLESGLMVEMLQPELETRMAILQRRAQSENAQVPDAVLYQIARGVKENVRVLEAALIRLLALASLTSSELTPELAARALSAFVQEAEIANISLIAIQRAVCEHFRIPVEEVAGPRRDRQTSLARQVAMYLMRDLTRHSLSEIGALFGGKTHSTVLYACAKMDKALETDAELAESLGVLRRRIAGESD